MISQRDNCSHFIEKVIVKYTKRPYVVNLFSFFPTFLLHHYTQSHKIYMNSSLYHKFKYITIDQDNCMKNIESKVTENFKVDDSF